jgi:hypothetical protein
MTRLTISELDSGSEAPLDLATHPSLHLLRIREAANR